MNGKEHLSSSEMIELKNSYEFLRGRVESEGAWGGMFENIKGCEELCICHLKDFNTFELLRGGDFYGGVSSLDVKYIQEVAEYLKSNPIDDLTNIAIVVMGG